MTLYLKLFAGLALLIALVGGGAWGYHAIREAGRQEGIAETQVKWDADKLAIQAAADKQALANAAELAETKRNNQEQHDAYEAKLASAAADRDTFARGLQGALASLAANSGGTAQVPGGQGTADPGAPSSAELIGRLSERVADARSECVQNAEQLDKLIAEVTPQIDGSQ